MRSDDIRRRVRLVADRPHNPSEEIRMWESVLDLVEIALDWLADRRKKRKGRRR